MVATHASEERGKDKTNGVTKTKNFQDEKGDRKSYGTLNDQSRTSILGAWVLDKTRGQPSMRGYLETMGVDALAIEAHEKGDAEHDTIHTMSIEPNSTSDDNTSMHHDRNTDAPSIFCIYKQSRVNDLKLRVPLDNEWHDEDLGVMTKAGSTAYVSPKTRSKAPPPERKIKSTRVTMDGSDRIQIESRLPTMNGVARVVDIKTLITNDVDINGRALPIVLKQELTIWNEKSNKSHTTVRYFVPYQSKDVPHITPPTARAQSRSVVARTSNEPVEKNQTRGSNAPRDDKIPNSNNPDRVHSGSDIQVKSMKAS